MNTIDPGTKDSSGIDALLAEIRHLRLTFGADEEIAHDHALALANAAEEAVCDDILERNECLLDELRTVTSSVTWTEYSVSGFSITIMSAQYLGLLKLLMAFWQCCWQPLRRQSGEVIMPWRTSGSRRHATWVAWRRTIMDTSNVYVAIYRLEG